MPHVCPWWLGYFHLSPIRRMLQDPVRILGPYVQPGMKVLDVGCGMGFFTLDMARMVGENGRVYAIDLQERMIRVLRKRVKRAELADRIESRVCSEESLCADDLAGSLDLIAAFNVVHEVPDSGAFLGELHSLLAPGGRLLLVEPAGHVSEEAFEKTLSVAKAAGFTVVEHTGVKRSRSALLERV